MSRNNYNGFFYTGEVDPSEGGKYGQMICYNCIAKNNRGTPGGGFVVTGSGNRVLTINCKSIGNLYGFMTSSNAYMELIDCGSKDNQTNSSGNITINNTNLVTQ